MKFAVLFPLAGLTLASAVAAQPALEATPAISQLPGGEIVFRDYPGRALDAGEQGKVGFRVKADDKGYPVSCEITSSSGYSQLDNDTCRLLMVHATFKPLPGAPAGVVNTGVVSWKIEPWLLQARKEATSAKKRPTPRFGWSKAARNPDKLEIATADGSRQVCKRVPRTGTLSGFDRLCRSKEDWAKTNEANGFWADQQGRAGNTSR